MLVISLKFTSSSLRQNMRDTKWLDSPDAIAFVLALMDALSAMPLSSNDLVLMYCFNLMCLKEYQDLATRTQTYSDIASKLNELNQRLRVTVRRIYF